MRYRLASLVVLAIVVGLVAAPIPKAKPPKDEEAIQGVWQVDKFDFGPGVPIPPLDFTQMRFTFKAGGKMAMTMGDMPGKEGDYKLDSAAKVKAIDMTESGRVSPGIYELDGDTLKICLAEGANVVRPTEMKPDAKGVAVVTFKRVKDEKKEK